MTLIDLPFNGPVLNAAGTLGFNPAPRGIDLSGLDGFVTNPVSLAPRTAASGARLLRYPGGLLLHTGYPNPGLRKVLIENRTRWARSPLPLIVHLLAGSPDEVYRMVRILEEVEGVRGIELGLPPGAGPEMAGAMVQAAVGELPVLARASLEDLPALAAVLVDAGASAVVIGPPRGVLPDGSGRLVSGRLAGSAVFPLAMGALTQVAPQVRQLVFSGGIASRSEIAQALSAGAIAVQLDLLLWRLGSFSAPAGSSSGHR